MYMKSELYSDYFEYYVPMLLLQKNNFSLWYSVIDLKTCNKL